MTERKRAAGKNFSFRGRTLRLRLPSVRGTLHKPGASVRDKRPNGGIRGGGQERRAGHGNLAVLRKSKRAGIQGCLGGARPGHRDTGIQGLGCSRQATWGAQLECMIGAAGTHGVAGPTGKCRGGWKEPAATM